MEVKTNRPIFYSYGKRTGLADTCNGAFILLSQTVLS